jgi:hypothetical protein
MENFEFRTIVLKMVFAQNSVYIIVCKTYAHILQNLFSKATFL